MKPFRILQLGNAVIFKALFALFVGVGFVMAAKAFGSDIPVLGIAAPLFVISLLAVFNTAPTGSRMFASVLDIATFTFTTDELRELREFVAEKLFAKPELTEWHILESPIESGKKIGILGRFGLVGKAGILGSNPTPHANTITGSVEKTWAPAFVSSRIEESYVDVVNSLVIFAQKKGVKRADMTDTEYVQFIQARLEDALMEAIFRHAYFGDTAAATSTASPAGVLTPGTDPAYWNGINGFWKQFFSIGTTTPARRITITKNSGVTKALQEFDDTDTTNKVAIKTLQNMKLGADYRLRDSKNLVYVVTQSIADQYERELQSYTNVEGSYVKLENGIKRLMFNNIPVIPFSFQDRMIRAYMDNGTTYYRPHRAFLTTADQLRIGFDTEEILNQLKVFFAEYQRVNVYEFEMKMDAKIVEDYQIQLAY